MRRLIPSKVQWIVLHTAESVNDASVVEIRRWHIEERGWEDIGYHYVVRQDGRVETGRLRLYQGAHVYGLNDCSIGICFSGNGDKEGWTPAQKAAGLKLIQKLLLEYQLPLSSVIGHRGINRLIDEGLVPETLDGKTTRTTKNCPGLLIDLAEVRRELPLVPDVEPKIAV